MAYDNFSILKIYLAPGVPDTAVLTLSDDVASIKVSNELSYQSSPTRSNDMTLRNDEEAFYVPTVEVTFAYLTPEIYSVLMQVGNSKGFFVSYYDYELGEEVFRAVYMSERSLSKLHNSVVFSGGEAQARLEGEVGVTVKMVSRYGYAYTKSGDANCTSGNKYHMYQLHLHKTYANYNPTNEEAPNYV